VKSYLELKDMDRIYVIFLIRELTFQKGNSLAVDKECGCGKMCKIELNRHNMVLHEIDPKLEKYFDPSTRSFKFKLKNGKTFDIAPPNIGLQKSFTEYIMKESSNDKKINTSFLKIIPLTLHDRTSITYEGIQKKLTEYQDPNIMDDISFQFLNSAAGKMTFGPKELRKKCDECGQEVRTEMTFPNGASGIFVIHDAFDAYIEE